MIDIPTVITAYHLILGRSPENDEAIENMAQEETIKDLGARLMATPEFRRRATYGTLSTKGGQWVLAEIRYSLQIWIDLLDFSVATGILRDDWQRDETNFLLSILEPGDCFIDVGANVGWFTLLAAHAVGASGEVHAFEPRSDIHDRLCKTVKSNNFDSRCTIYPIAVGGCSGTMQIASMSHKKNPGHSFIVTDEVPVGAVIFEDVLVRPLDAFFFRKPIKILRIDVESAEAMVLNGARKLIERDCPIIVSEIFPYWLKTVSKIEAQAHLDSIKALGYRIFELSKNGIGREIHQLTFTSFKNDIHFNTIAIPVSLCRKYLNFELDRQLEGLEDLLPDTQGRTSQEITTSGAQASLEISQSKEQASIEIMRFHEKADLYSSAIINQSRLEVSEFQGEIALAYTNLQVNISELQQIRATLLPPDIHLSSFTENVQHSEGCADLPELQIRYKEEEDKILIRNFEERFNARIRELDGTARRAQLALIEIQQSTSWKITKPLRAVGKKFPVSLRQHALRVVRVLWWTATLKLPQRLRERSIRAKSSRGPLADNFNSATLHSKVSFAVLHDINLPIALIIDDRWPQPDRDAGSVEAMNLIGSLVAMGFRTLFTADGAFDDRGDDRDRVSALGVYCIGSSDALSVRDFIENFGKEISLVILTRVNSGGRYYELVRHHCTFAKIIFNTVDLHFLREEREAAVRNDVVVLATALKTKDRELRLVRGADATIVVSSTERVLLSGLHPEAKILELPLGISSTADPKPYDVRTGIGFIGGFAHAPNVDAIEYFLSRIWPLILIAVPQCHFSIVGTGLPEHVIAKLPQNVEYLGYLPDIANWFSKLRLTVAPLRYGAGMKGKVISSLAAGVPCVGTSIAAEGMAAVVGKEILVADTPEDFANAVLSIYSNANEWKSLSSAGHAYVQHENSIPAFRSRLHSLIVELGLPSITPI